MFVFIDLSYLIFHRYYAIVAWSRLSKTEVDVGSIDFNLRLMQGFDQFLKKIKKKLALTNMSTQVYFIKDTSRGLIWRNQIFQEYKMNRCLGSKQQDDNLPKVFAHVYDVVIPELNKLYGIQYIQVETAEADDVIAVACEVVRGAKKDVPVTIISNDNDFVQLHELNIDIMNANLLKIASRFDDEELAYYTLWKVIKGDKSDNIPAIDKKIGDKTALKLAKNPDMLKKRIESSDAVAKQFHINSTLIDFKNIPIDLKEKISKLVVQKMI